MKKQRVVYAKLNCTTCTQQLTIPRKVGRQHQAGHIKHMHCPQCRSIQPFEEKVQTDASVQFWVEWQKNHTTDPPERPASRD